MQVYPLKFRPIYKERIWGGTMLQETFKRQTPKGKKIGESWELADLPNDKSVITNGKLSEQTLSEALSKYPLELTGKSNFSPPFPVLVKFLDCGDLLSVQVHPDKATCLRLGKGDFKSEYWYIVRAEPQAVIYKGLKKGVTKQDFEQAIKEGTVETTLNKIAVSPGECHYLPAGAPHSIGGGLLIAEIQTPSDTTYRVFDWNRLDEKGEPRPLHIKEALESIHFDSSADNLATTSIGRLADCEFFIIDKGHQARNCESLLREGKMKILIFLTGFGTITNRHSTVDFCAGDTILLPFAYQGVIHFCADSEYLTITIQEEKIA